jgi:segregation and condensation protein A
VAGPGTGDSDTVVTVGTANGNGAAAEADITSAAGGEARGSAGFEVHLDVFEGPFDLLLALISKHKLDITEVALSQVTDEFIGYIRERSGGWDLDQVSYFLVVAATLLDLKAARLLPSGEVEDEEDLALLEARDLLFARLLQYRAYKEVAAVFAGRMTVAARRFPRRVPMEPRFAQLFPEVLLGLGPAEFARIAARVLTPRRAPTVSTDHIHAPFVSVREQARRMAAKLRQVRRASFRRLTGDYAATYEIVACFLALLELYRENRISLEQLTPLGEIYVTWTGTDDDDDDNVADGADDDWGAGNPEAENPAANASPGTSTAPGGHADGAAGGHADGGDSVAGDGASAGDTGAGNDASVEDE